MDWGTYLARGAPKFVEVKYESVTRQETILKYVEDYFRNEGASGFSSKIAVGYLQVGNESFVSFFYSFFLFM